MTESQERRLFGENTTTNHRRKSDIAPMLVVVPSNTLITVLTVVTIGLFILSVIF